MGRPQANVLDVACRGSDSDRRLQLAHYSARALLHEKWDRRVTAITHRKAAVYPATIVGIPSMEDFYMGGAFVKLFLPIFKMNVPEIVDIALPAEGVFHNLVFVSITKTYPMQAYKICAASGAWGR